MGISCVSCGYDNDPTRVYCHSCGKKLERGSVAAPPPSGFTHPTDVTSIKRTRPSVPWYKYFAFLLKLVFSGALVFAAVLALLPPRHMPPASQPDVDLARRVVMLVDAASTADGPRSFSLPALDVGRCIAGMARPKNEDRASLESVYSATEDGSFRVGLKTRPLGLFYLYFEAEYAPVVAGFGYGLQPLRYSVGRLPLPFALSWLVEMHLRSLSEALAVPLSQLATASYIGISPDNVTVRWAGASR